MVPSLAFFAVEISVAVVGLVAAAAKPGTRASADSPPRTKAAAAMRPSDARRLDACRSRVRIMSQVSFVHAGSWGMYGCSCRTDCALDGIRRVQSVPCRCPYILPTPRRRGGRNMVRTGVQRASSWRRTGGRIAVVALAVVGLSVFAVAPSAAAATRATTATVVSSGENAKLGTILVAGNRAVYTLKP